MKPPDQIVFWLEELKKELPKLRYPANPYLDESYADECRAKTKEALEDAIAILRGCPFPQCGNDPESQE